MHDIVTCICPCIYVRVKETAKRRMKKTNPLSRCPLARIRCLTRSLALLRSRHHASSVYPILTPISVQSPPRYKPSSPIIIQGEGHISEQPIDYTRLDLRCVRGYIRRNVKGYEHIKPKTRMPSIGLRFPSTPHRLIG